MKKYLVALDQGTTSSRAIVFDRSQQIVASAQKEFPQLYPQAGWVEHDPLELYSSQYGVMMEAITRGGIDPAEIAAIGITNQRETTIVWEKATGRPIYPAIVWQCRRTAALCDRLRADGLTEHIRAVTGLVPDAYFSATKIRWILDHVPGAQERAERGELLFGTVDSWLVWKLTRGRVHATDVTNASRTMLFDIRRLDWDETLLQVLRIPRCMLPDVRPSSGDFGTCNIQGVEIPIAGAAGDQQAALFGQCCLLATPVRRPVIRETTALGAAYLAGLAVGIWHDPDELRRQWRCDVSFLPHMTAEQREKNRRGWAKAVGRSLDWAKEE